MVRVCVFEVSGGLCESETLDSVHEWVAGPLGTDVVDVVVGVHIRISDARVEVTDVRIEAAVESFESGVFENETKMAAELHMSLCGLEDGSIELIRCRAIGLTYGIGWHEAFFGHDQGLHLGSDGREVKAVVSDHTIVNGSNGRRSGRGVRGKNRACISADFLGQVLQHVDRVDWLGDKLLGLLHNVDGVHRLGDELLDVLHILARGGRGAADSIGYSRSCGGRSTERIELDAVRRVLDGAHDVGEVGDRKIEDAEAIRCEFG